MNLNPVSDIKSAWAWVAKFAQRVFGARSVGIAIVLFVVVSGAADLMGKTSNAWAHVKRAFTEKTSVLNTAEIEVLDEWVVLIDSAETFSQAEAYRQAVVAAFSEISNQAARNHFARNLRVVRNPLTSGSWLLVADITQERSSSEEVAATIGCIQKQISSWAEDDVVSPWLRNARPFDYSLADFNRTHGRATNALPQHELPARTSEPSGPSNCAAPYDTL